MRNKGIKKALLSLTEIGDSYIMPDLEAYESTRAQAARLKIVKGLYFSITLHGEGFKAERVAPRSNEPSVAARLLEMPVGASFASDEREYNNLHSSAHRLRRNRLGEWRITKKREVVTTVRIN